MIEFIYVLLLLIVVLLGIYILSVWMSDGLKYSRCTSIGVSVLLYLSIPHQIVILNKFVFNIGLKNSLLFFLVATIFTSTNFSVKNVSLIRNIIASDFSFIANNKVWLAALVFPILAYCLVGAAFAPSTIDELAYHVPQLIGALQTNDLYSYISRLPWVVSYPQGTALVWAMFGWAGKSDAFIRMPQILYLISMLFSVAAILSKLSTNRSLIFTACLAIASMPVVYILATTNRADLAYAAYLVGMLSIVFPAKDNPRYVVLIFTILFFASATVKLPIISGIEFIVFGIAYLYTKKNAAGVKHIVDFRSQEVYCFCLTIVFFSLSFYPYISNYLIYGNPLYPVNVTVLGKEIFTGPLKIDLPSGHTTFGNIHEFGRLRVWQAVIFDWYSPLNEDSYGSSGAFVGIFALPMSIICLFIALFSRVKVESKWLLLMLSFCVLPYLIPSLVLPRYHLFFTVILIISSIYVLNFLMRDHSRPIVAALIVFMIPSLFTIFGNLMERYNWVISNAGKFDRGVSIFTKYKILDGMGPSPSAIKHLKDNSFSNIYYCGNMFPGLMWNDQLDNNVIYIGGQKDGCDLARIEKLGRADIFLCDTGICGKELVFGNVTYSSKSYGMTDIYESSDN